MVVVVAAAVAAVEIRDYYQNGRFAAAAAVDPLDLEKLLAVVLALAPSAEWCGDKLKVFLVDS